MKSIIKALNCPCGCELGVSASLELAYNELRRAGFDATGVVYCATGKREIHATILGRPVDEQQRKLQKVVQQASYKMLAEYMPEVDKWRVRTGLPVSEVRYTRK